HLGGRAGVRSTAGGAVGGRVTRSGTGCTLAGLVTGGRSRRLAGNPALQGLDQALCLILARNIELGLLHVFATALLITADGEAVGSVVPLGLVPILIPENQCRPRPLGQNLLVQLLDQQHAVFFVVDG